jgi:hypothetical protein
MRSADELLCDGRHMHSLDMLKHAGVMLQFGGRVLFCSA